ncbi:hypothetical protein HDU97_005008 [Phlyctochytrium planicorne]|nr:hypothetical protein HDU97_005008 [Phlyctochytrium planicorne]
MDFGSNGDGDQLRKEIIHILALEPQSLKTLVNLLRRRFAVAAIVERVSMVAYPGIYSKYHLYSTVFLEVNPFSWPRYDRREKLKAHKNAQKALRDPKMLKFLEIRERLQHQQELKSTLLAKIRRVPCEETRSHVTAKFVDRVKLACLPTTPSREDFSNSDGRQARKRTADEAETSNLSENAVFQRRVKVRRAVELDNVETTIYSQSNVSPPIIRKRDLEVAGFKSPEYESDICVSASTASPIKKKGRLDLHGNPELIVRCTQPTTWPKSGGLTPVVNTYAPLFRNRVFEEITDVGNASEKGVGVVVIEEKNLDDMIANAIYILEARIAASRNFS